MEESKKKKRILIMDDMEMNRILLGSHLRVNGFDFDSVSNGLEGLELLKKNQYDCIFSDIEMPNMNGFEFLARIKKDPVLKNLPVVILSSLKKDEEINKAMTLGAAFYMIKPFTYEKMKEALIKVGLK